MVEFKYRKGDMLANLDKASIFLHANNSKGRWSRGIASSFAKKFPGAYLEHRNRVNKVGTGYVLEDKGFKIGCLITSKGFGAFVDPPKVITINTYHAVKSLLESIPDMEVVIQSPKINSGLFKTPWQWTRKAITKACRESEKKVIWVVWEL